MYFHFVEKNTVWVLQTAETQISKGTFSLEEEKDWKLRSRRELQSLL